ncbi:MAG: hypothetical protein NVS9B4_02110 [Candidatus Acidiferrum sp.]
MRGKEAAAANFKAAALQVRGLPGNPRADSAGLDFFADQAQTEPVVSENSREGLNIAKQFLKAKSPFASVFVALAFGVSCLL